MKPQVCSNRVWVSIALAILFWAYNVRPQYSDLKLSDVLHAKALIRWIINNRTENGTHTFNAGYIRMAFHDCVGGCDGCVNLDVPGNQGLGFYKVPLDIMYRLLGQQWMTRADWYALAGLTAVEYAAELTPCEGDGCIPHIPFKWGRPNCFRERSVRRDIPQTFFDNRNLLRHQFRLNLVEVTALLGAHTLGKAHGAGAKWVNKAHYLDNEFYKDLINPSLNWTFGLRSNADTEIVRSSWSHADGSNIMFNTDITLAYDFLNNREICRNNPVIDCPHTDTYNVVKYFANNNKAWLRSFGQAFTVMLNNGNHGTLKSITIDTNETVYLGQINIPDPNAPRPVLTTTTTRRPPNFIPTTRSTSTTMTTTKRTTMTTTSMFAPTTTQTTTSTTTPTTTSTTPTTTTLLTTTTPITTSTMTPTTTPTATPTTPPTTTASTTFTSNTRLTITTTATPTITTITTPTTPTTTTPTTLKATHRPRPTYSSTTIRTTTPTVTPTTTPTITPTTPTTTSTTIPTTTPTTTPTITPANSLTSTSTVGIISRETIAQTSVSEQSAVNVKTNSRPEAVPAQEAFSFGDPRVGYNAEFNQTFPIVQGPRRRL